MVQEARDLARSGLGGELDAALTTLESSLAEAGRAVGALRGIIPQIAALVEVVDQMEAAMARARQHLSAPSGAGSQTATASPALRPVPPHEAPPAPSGHETSPDEPNEVAPAAEAEPGGSASHCLRVDVRSKTGSLDLKAVDSSVNENPAVVDVALLDYDGRHATLRVWVGASADPTSVRQALLESLQQHLAEQADAEVRIDFEEESGT